jgi:hypothetical protein
LVMDQRFRDQEEGGVKNSSPGFRLVDRTH